MLRYLSTGILLVALIAEGADLMQIGLSPSGQLSFDEMSGAATYKID
jgi:hypothetical protein